MVNEKIVDHGMLAPTTSLKQAEIDQNLASFENSVLEIIERHNIGPNDKVVLERYMRRQGAGKGGNDEIINVLIGIVLQIMRSRGIHITLRTAASWKVHMRRYHGIDDGMHKFLGGKRASGLTAHEADAIGLACHLYEKETGVQCVTTCFTPKRK